MPHNSPVPYCSHVRLHKKHSKTITILVSNNIITCHLDLLVFQRLFRCATKYHECPYKGVSGWMGWGGWWAKVALQTQWDQLLCQRSRQWSLNHTTSQSRPTNNSHRRLGAVSHQYHLIKAHQALSLSYQSSTGS